MAVNYKCKCNYEKLIRDRAKQRKLVCTIKWAEICSNMCNKHKLWILHFCIYRQQIFAKFMNIVFIYLTFYGFLGCKHNFKKNTVIISTEMRWKLKKSIIIFVQSANTVS